MRCERPPPRPRGLLHAGLGPRGLLFHAATGRCGLLLRRGLNDAGARDRVSSSSAGELDDADVIVGECLPVHGHEGRAGGHGRIGGGGRRVPPEVREVWPGGGKGGRGVDGGGRGVGPRQEEQG